MANNIRTHMMDSASERSPMVRKHLTKQEFGKKLYRLMAKQGWSQSDLAREAALPRDAISRYIREVSMPEPKNLVKLAEVFKMKPEDLLPNYAEVEIELASDSPLEIKVSTGDPSMAWLRINRMIKVSHLPKILAALEAAEND